MMTNNNTLVKKIIIIFSILSLSMLFIIIVFFNNNKSNYFKGRLLIGKSFHQQNVLGRPSGILYSAGKLIIFDRSPISDGKQVSIYNSETHKLLYSFGRKGSGPGEYQGLWSIDRKVANENKITLLDLILHRYTILDITDSTKIEIDTMITLKEGEAYCPVFVNDSTIISIGGLLKQGRFAEYGLDGNIRKYLGELLPGKKSETPIPIHQQASIGRLKVTPDGSKYVICAYESDYIDIYNNDGTLKKRIEGPLGLPPQYKVRWIAGEPNCAFDQEKGVSCYLDIALSNDKIYALYSGEPSKNPEVAGRYLHVYNMEGRFIETLIVDNKLRKISYDPFKRQLFGIQVSPLPELYMYQL